MALFRFIGLFGLISTLNDCLQSAMQTTELVTAPSLVVAFHNLFQIGRLNRPGFPGGSFS